MLSFLVAEQEKELAERNSRIRQLEEAPRADDEHEEEEEMEEGDEEKVRGV